MVFVRMPFNGAKNILLIRWFDCQTKIKCSILKVSRPQAKSRVCFIPDFVHRPQWSGSGSSSDHNDRFSGDLFSIQKLAVHLKLMLK